MQHLDEQDQVKAEVKAMAELTHPCIVDLREVLSNDRCVFMVMQYCPGGELYDIVRARGPFDEATARRHFQRLIQGVDFCHKKRIYHRDLKPENLFLDECGEVCIGDFGLAALRQDADDNNLRTICGTPHFSAPEVMGGSRRLVGNKNFKTVNTHTREHGYDGGPADVWSCGCILYFLLTGKFPFDGKNFVQLQLMVQKTEPYFAGGAVSKHAQKLIRGMLVKDPVKRWTIPTVMRQSWFTQDYVPVEVKHEGTNARFFDEEDPTLAEFMTPDERLVVKESSHMSVSESAHMRPIKQLNAFELINIAAFDVADIFDDDDNTVNNATRFMSTEPPERVQEAVCRAAESLDFVARRQTKARIMFTCDDLGLVVMMRTYQVVPGVYLYTFSRDEGGREHFHEWFEKICAPKGAVGKMIHVA